MFVQEIWDGNGKTRRFLSLSIVSHSSAKEKRVRYGLKLLG